MSCYTGRTYDASEYVSNPTYVDESLFADIKVVKKPVMDLFTWHDLLELKSVSFLTVN